MGPYVLRICFSLGGIAASRYLTLVCNASSHWITGAQTGRVGWRLLRLTPVLNHNLLPNPLFFLISAIDQAYHEGLRWRTVMEGTEMSTGHGTHFLCQCWGYNRKDQLFASCPNLDPERPKVNNVWQGCIHINCHGNFSQVTFAGEEELIGTREPKSGRLAGWWGLMDS